MTACLHSPFRRDHSAFQLRLRSVLLLVLLALVAATNAHEVYAQQSESRVALVIGNADYPDGEGAAKGIGRQRTRLRG